MSAPGHPAQEQQLQRSFSELKKLFKCIDPTSEEERLSEITRLSAAVFAKKNSLSDNHVQHVLKNITTQHQLLDHSLQGPMCDLLMNIAAKIHQKFQVGRLTP